MSTVLFIALKTRIWKKKTKNILCRDSLKFTKEKFVQGGEEKKKKHMFLSQKRQRKEVCKYYASVHVFIHDNKIITIAKQVEIETSHKNRVNKNELKGMCLCCSDCNM